jgi:hypothetical protein
MAISDNIKAKAKQVRDEVDQDGVSPTALELHEKATRAIVGGIDDWVTYMQLFATNPAELARLIPTDGTTDDDHQAARAYLVRNGMCTETTTGMILDNVEDKLDTP